MRKQILKAVDGLTQRLGYRFIPQWRLRNWEINTHLADLFRMLEIDCIIDVGANRGQYRNMIRNELGYRGHIESFEPIPENAASMQQRAGGDPKWKIHQCALGAKDGSMPFNIMKQDMFSSFLKPDNSSTQQFDALNTVARVENVNLYRLDALFDEIKVRTGARNFYLKLDTQGYDLEVINGAKHCLSQVRAMQTEIAVKPLYVGMPGYMTSIESLTGMGFDITGLFPVTRDKSLRVVELDCTLINRAAVPAVTTTN